jgi:hypothetical protein
MPIETATAEATTLAVVAVEDREPLIKSGIDPVLVDTLPSRAAALSYTAARYELAAEADPEVTLQWKEVSPKGYELQKNLLRTFEFAYRKDKDLKKTVAKIREGRGHKDMVLDLLALAILGTEHPEPLDKIPMFDKTQLVEAKSMHTRLSDLLARMTIDPKKVEVAKEEFIRAYTYYKQAADEVKEHGQFVFEGTDRYKSYISAYYQAVGKMSNKAETETAPVTQTPA